MPTACTPPLRPHAADGIPTPPPGAARASRRLPRRLAAAVTGFAAALASVPVAATQTAAAPAPAGAASSSADAQPMPLLRCRLRYASETRTIEARPVADPYAVAPHDLGRRFRFKAVVVGTSQRVDHVALYTYDLALPTSPVLVHEAVHRPPFPTSAELPALTGWNHVYSSRLGREFVYGCALDAGAEAGR